MLVYGRGSIVISDRLLCDSQAEFFAANGVDAVKHDNCVDVANTTVPTPGKKSVMLRSKHRGKLIQIMLEVVLRTLEPWLRSGFKF